MNKKKQQTKITEQKKQQTDNLPQDFTISSSNEKFIQHIKQKIHSPSDLICKVISDEIRIIYLTHLVDGKSLKEDILKTLEGQDDWTPRTIFEKLPIPEMESSSNFKTCIQEILKGGVLIHVEGFSEVVIAKITTYQTRSLTAPENESQVVGSQIGFNESLPTNVSIVRRYITNPNLCNEQFTIGKHTNTSLSLLYIHGIASEDQVNTVRQRIQDLDINDLIDSANLAELIEDSSSSIFPQLLLTERPDRFCDGLLSGKLGIVVNGSSMAIVSPYSFFEFFQSREDQNLRWPIGTFVRLLRFIAIFIAIFATPMYVATLTFHYDVIPQPLIIPLSESRAIVPFPPVMEALLMELTIELLREAGARLPTKVGQTIGIVGGIVLGTAAVDAGLTSNVLIIIMALSALASFTTPNYVMGNSIRVVRFPIMIFAGFWGYYGLMLAFCIILIHLLRQSSLGAPYLAPFYPPRWKDWPNSIIRLPLPLIKRQPTNTAREESNNALINRSGGLRGEKVKE
ncbi:spore germination protein [Lysinibacillus yapensis]|uniref:Spore germination protein n=2 Tax=Ureibacillus yapensis TaxID=2304605 RepID=A0A396S993_9BACL|nr:spore germination protein [Lysinibacillus yapensis]